MTSIYDTEELARHICGLDQDDEEADVDDALYEKFDVDLDQFHKIVSSLLPMTTEAVSGFSGTAYQGFADRSRNLFLVKQPVQ